jgi:hypothetical protein
VIWRFRSFWGEILIKENLVDLSRDSQLRLKLSDAALRRRELQRLISRLADSLTTINLLLIDPDLDRRLRHPKRRRQLRDTRPRTSKLNDLTTHC